MPINIEKGRKEEEKTKERIREFLRENRDSEGETTGYSKKEIAEALGIDILEMPTVSMIRKVSSVEIEGTRYYYA